MTVLQDGMTLYHGSYTEIPTVDLSKCKPGKDFGRGFYLTTSFEQAQNFVHLSIKKQINEGNLSEDETVGYVSVFKLNLTEDIKTHYFETADVEWLHFVAANRRRSLFPIVRQNYLSYDIIGGKIANDQTARTLQLYTSGGYGTPGSAEADRIAIMTLLPNRLQDQFCFRTEKAVHALHFMRSERYDIGDSGI